MIFNLLLKCTLNLFLTISKDVASKDGRQVKCFCIHTGVLYDWSLQANTSSIRPRINWAHEIANG